MAKSHGADKGFQSAVIHDNMNYMLDAALEWIRDHMDPEDVFRPDQLADWANEHGFVVREPS
jgi:hypothetical protein